MYSLQHPSNFSLLFHLLRIWTLWASSFGLSLIVDFIFPFVVFLTMNSVIIHTIRTGKLLSATSQSNQRAQTHDKQIFVILLLVSFTFLILTTPTYILFLLKLIIDFNQVAPKYHAANRLFYSVAQKWNYTNNGINFFLYILSGTKFRNDFLQMFCQKMPNTNITMHSDVSTNSVGDVRSKNTRNPTTSDVTVDAIV